MDLLKVLSEKEIQAFDYKIQGYNQTDIAKFMCCSQSTVSRILANIEEEINKILNR